MSEVLHAGLRDRMPSKCHMLRVMIYVELSSRVRSSGTSASPLPWDDSATASTSTRKSWPLAVGGVSEV